jgi:alginate O-acetyltransferase complex protein AlgI
MTFVSLSYGLCLFCLLGIYWLVGSEWLRLWCLLIASLGFYASQKWTFASQPWIYIPVLLLAALINFQLGRLLANRSSLQTAARTAATNQDWNYAQEDWNQRRGWYLGLGIVFNVLLLFGFKYIPFVLTTVATIGPWPQAQVTADTLGQSLIAPLGLSFFCFECIAYLVDVYRGAPCTPSLLRFTAYKFFFPKLVMGPITRYHLFAAQLRSPQPPNLEQSTEALWLFARGAVKKSLLADPLGVLVKLSFDNLDRAGSIDIWLATIAYGLQLYLDFSGFVDMARGAALLMGIQLPENFRSPYFSTNLADFWRRWHMTLGDWLRNYLYFPLGGSRVGLWRTCLNLVIVMTIAGLWHGAAWGFVLWGLIHGLGLVIHRLVDGLSHRVAILRWAWQTLPGTILAWLLTQGLVFLAWIPFRLPDLADTQFAVSHLWGQRTDPQFLEKVYVGAMGIDRPHFALLLWAIGISMGLIYSVGRLTQLRLNWPVKLLLIPLCLYAVWNLAPEGGSPYLYFDF